MVSMSRNRIVSIVELVVTVVYLSLCTFFGGRLPQSLSCTSYIIPHYIDFSIYIVTVMVFVALTLFGPINRTCRFMVWLMLIGLADVALSPHYHTENTFLHYFGGVLCCVASVVYVAQRAPKVLYSWAVCFVLCALCPRCRILFEELNCLVEMMILNFFVMDGAKVSSASSQSASASGLRSSDPSNKE